jgi:hypothetical protein
VVAQLLLPRKEDPNVFTNHGPQTFIMQIRDENTHQPLSGIAVGDIGPKYGTYSSVVSSPCSLEDLGCIIMWLSAYAAVRKECPEVARTCGFVIAST